MLVYEKPAEGGGTPEPLETSPNPETQLLESKLSKLGITGVTPDILERIESDAVSKKALHDDMDALAAKNPPSPAELARLDIVYIKGFGQVIDTPYGPLSFSEIQKHPKKDEILDDVMTPSQSKNFNDWLKARTQAVIEGNKGKLEVQQAVIEGNKGKLEVQQAVIEGNKGKLEKLIELNSKLESSTNTIRSISPDIEQKALAEATKNPPKELAGVPPEQYGEYKNLILADYTISHAVEIEKSLDVNDRKAFSKSVDEMSGIIGRRPPNWPEIVETRGGLVLGERREEIRSLGERYIRDGYDESVVWDSQSRSLIFRGKNGEKIIDTAPIPPQERITQAGISISREAPPKRYSPIETSHERLDRDTTSQLDAIASETGRFAGRIDSTSDDTIASNMRIARQSPNTKNKFIYTYSALDTKKKALEASKENALTNKEIAEANALEGDIRETERQIEAVENLAKEYEKSLKTITEDSENTKEDAFDSTARTNLDWLTSEDTLFQRMGPDGNRALYRMIDAMNRGRDPANQISLSTSVLSIVDRQKLQESYKKLGGDMSTLRDGEKIRDFQRQISTAVEKPVGAPGSIESLLMAVDTKPKTPEKSAQNI